MQTKGLQKRDQKWKTKSIVPTAKPASASRVLFVMLPTVSTTMGITHAVQSKLPLDLPMQIAPPTQFVPLSSRKPINSQQIPKRIPPSHPYQ